jgi:hypothetical protein
MNSLVPYSSCPSLAHLVAFHKKKVNSYPTVFVDSLNKYGYRLDGILWV